MLIPPAFETSMQTESSGILTRTGAVTVCGGRIPPREA
jgi:hypothetical protein